MNLICHHLILIQWYNAYRYFCYRLYTFRQMVWWLNLVFYYSGHIQIPSRNPYVWFTRIPNHRTNIINKISIGWFDLQDYTKLLTAVQARSKNSLRNQICPREWLLEDAAKSVGMGNTLNSDFFFCICCCYIKWWAAFRIKRCKMGFY